MPDEVWVVQLDTKQVEAAAPQAAGAVEQLEGSLDRLDPAADRARDAMGRFASVTGKQVQVFREAAGGVYELSDAFVELSDRYEVLPSKGNAYRAALVQQQAAAELAAEAARQQAAAQASLQSLMEGQSPAVQQASQKTQQYARNLQDLGRSAGSGGAGRGILLLSQTIDDAQYGFRSIVNNIPILGIEAARAFGASNEAAAGFGGALGLLAVAINVNMQHAEDWRDLMRGVGAEDYFKPIVDGWNSVTFATERAAVAAQRAADAQRVKSGEAAEKSIEAIKSPEQEAAAKAFQAAVKATGGGKSLLDQLIAADRGANPNRSKEDQEKAERNIALLAEDARGGSETAADEIAKRLGGENKTFGHALKSAREAPELAAAAKEEQARIDRESAEAAAANEAIDKAAEDDAKQAEKDQADLAKLKEGVDEARKDAERQEAHDAGADIIATGAARGGANEDQIAQLLIQQGVPEDLARQMAQDAATGARRESIQGAFGKGEQSRSSEVISGGTALADALQSSVGGTGDTAQQHLKETQRTNEILTRLLQQPPGARDFVFKR